MEDHFEYRFKIFVLRIYNYEFVFVRRISLIDFEAMFLSFQNPLIGDDGLLEHPKPKEE